MGECKNHFYPCPLKSAASADWGAPALFIKQAKLPLKKQIKALILIQARRAELIKKIIQTKTNTPIVIGYTYFFARPGGTNILVFMA